MDPRTVYFRDMIKGEKRDQRVQVKNTSGKSLEIISIKSDDNLIDIGFVNHSPEGPIALKPDESLDLLVSMRYQWDQARIRRNLRVTYTGGEANEADIRLYAELQRQVSIQEKLQENAPQANTPQRQLSTPKTMETE